MEDKYLDMSPYVLGKKERKDDNMKRQSHSMLHAFSNSEHEIIL